MLSFLNACIGTFMETVTEKRTELGAAYKYQTLYDLQQRDNENRKHIAIFITHEQSRYEREVVREVLIHVDRRLGLKEIAVEFHIYNLTTNINYAYDVVSCAMRDHDQVDALLSIGDHPSQVVRDVRRIYGTEIPHFFTAVVDPVTVGLLDAFGEPIRNTTGSQLIQPSYSGQLEFLDTIKPTIQNVLIPYDEHGPKSLSNPGKESLCAELLEFGYHVEVQAVSEKMHSRAPFFKNVSDYDLIVLDTHSTIVRSNMSDLVELCEMAGTTLMASNATSVFEGAALGFGNTGTQHGKVMSEQVVLYLLSTLSMSNVPAREVRENTDLCFNPQTMRKQGIDITRAIEFALNAVPVSERYNDQTTLTVE